MKSAHPLTLFIVKKFHGSGGHSQISNGLYVSALFVVNMLLAEGKRAKLAVAVDGNSIDALVTQNAPARVVLEAIWVTPAKMAELRKRHPAVRWTIRVHSELPFLANEGCAISWIADFLKQGIEVAFNSGQTAADFSVMGKVVYLPNYYHLRKPRMVKPADETLDVGCFGAVRPLKNQLIQAFAAVQFARSHKKKLIFHMNGSRIEQDGSNNLKNLQALLAATGETLKLHPWAEHDEFLELVADMDICLQVSLSESFNITSADAVSMGVPLVGSPAITWLPERSRASVDSVESICEAMGRADRTMVIMNTAALKTYLSHTVNAWNAWLSK